MNMSNLAIDDAYSAEESYEDIIIKKKPVAKSEKSKKDKKAKKKKSEKVQKVEKKEVVQEFKYKYTDLGIP